MEESHEHLIWMKRKQMLKSHLEGGSCNIKSWEERAFAEDTARIVGGCIWPPRSYTCTFCKREFRSAQALGGHMNVHRRDRARLKQSLNHSNSSLPHPQFQLDSCLNPNSSITTTTTLSPSATPENCGDQQNIYSCSASIISKVHSSESEDLKGLMSCHHVETDLSVGLNYSMFGQKLPCGDDDGDGGMISSCKRPKTCVSNSNSLPVLLKPCSNDRLLAFHSAEIVLGLKPGAMEDLDLELRLGKPQKV